MSGGFENVDLYEAPDDYDRVFDEGSAAEADFLVVMEERYGKARGAARRRFLEPACGTGRLMIEMTARGYEAFGFDLSEAMLRKARERARLRGLELGLWRDSMEAFRRPPRKAGLAASLISSFKYLHNEASAVAHLERVAGSLASGGLFVLGLHLTDPTREHAVHERWVASVDGVEVVCNTRTWPADRRRRRERVRTRLSIRSPDGEVRRRESVWEFRTYDAAQLRRLLRRVPALRLVAAHDFDYDPGRPRELDDSQEDIVLVLRKERS